MQKEGKSKSKISGKNKWTSSNFARPGKPPKPSPSEKQYLKRSSLRERRKSNSTLDSVMKILTDDFIHPSMEIRRLWKMYQEKKKRKQTIKE